ELFRIQEFINTKGGPRRLSLISAGTISRRKTGAPSSPIPYNIFENAFLRFVSELKAADLDGNGRSKDEEQLTVLDGQKADLEAAIARTRARPDYMKVPAFQDDVARWSTELQEVKSRCEQLAAKLASNEAEALHS